MNRRWFIGVIAGSHILIPPAVAAQQAGRVRRIGWLWNFTPSTTSAIQRRTMHLRPLGWIEGQNLVIEQRYAGGNTALLPALAEELVRLKVEIIVAGLALTAGAFGRDIYAVVVGMVVITALLVPPLMGGFVRRGEPEVAVPRKS